MNDTDRGTVEISVESARTALRELDTLIDATEGQDPDPLTDDVFQARDELDDELTPDDRLSRDDVYETPDGQVQVVELYPKEVVVTDPTVNHPQDSRYGRWRIDRNNLQSAIESGEIESTTLTTT